MKEQEKDQGSRIRTGEAALGRPVHAETAIGNARTLDKPLSAVVRDGVLTVEIGVNTLAHSATYSDWANPWDDERYDYFRTFAITDAAVFAKDVALAMLSEAEDGSSPVTRFIDKAMSDAVDDGSMACCEDEHLIRFGQTAPCETWATERTTDEDCAEILSSERRTSDRPRDNESASAALSTLRTSLRGLRDKMAAESDLIAVMSDQDNNNAQVAARRLREFAAELDALIGDTP